MPGTQASVKIVNVGQGDCILVTTPGGDLVLIDAGTTSTGRGGVAAAFLADIRTYLWGATGVPQRAIAAIVMTHHDTDHYNLLGRVVQAAPILRCYYSGDANDYSERAYVNWVMGQRLLANEMISVDVNAPGTPPVNIFREVTDNGAVFELNIIASNCPAPDLALESVKTNTRSIVVLGTLSMGGTVMTQFLLGADATQYTENYLCAQYGAQIRSDLVKVPHHGAERSSTAQFVTTVNPNEAVFSCNSVDAQLAHPKGSVVDLWRAQVDPTDNRHTITDWIWNRDFLVNESYVDNDVNSAVWTTYDNGHMSYVFTQVGEFIRVDWQANVNAPGA